MVGIYGINTTELAKRGKKRDVRSTVFLQIQGENKPTISSGDRQRVSRVNYT